MIKLVLTQLQISTRKRSAANFYMKLKNNFLIKIRYLNENYFLQLFNICGFQNTKIDEIWTKEVEIGMLAIIWAS